MPPIAGLQLIWAILFISIVTRQVFLPKFAAAAAASQPAWPAPITNMSYSNITLCVNMLGLVLKGDKWMLPLFSDAKDNKNIFFAWQVIFNICHL
jgi:hypothetical protein